MAEDLPYQIAPQVEALKQERANCVAYGNDSRVEAIDRQLAGLGVKAKAAEERKAAEGDAKQKAPEGRRAASKSST